MINVDVVNKKSRSSDLEVLMTLILSIKNPAVSVRSS